jgi:hypothetical protein
MNQQLEDEEGTPRVVLNINLWKDGLEQWSYVWRMASDRRSPV